MTVIYKDTQTGCAYIKRTRIEGYILNRNYLMIPEHAIVLYIVIQPEVIFMLEYEPKPRMRKHTEQFKAADYPEKGLKTQDIRLSEREVCAVNVII